MTICDLFQKKKKPRCYRNVFIYIKVHWQRDWRKISGHKEYLLKGKIYTCVQTEKNLSDFHMFDGTV